VLVISHDAHRNTSLWAEEMQAGFSVFVDSDGSVTRQYCGSSAPCAVLVDEQGRVTMSGTIRQGGVQRFRVGIPMAATPRVRDEFRPPLSQRCCGFALIRRVANIRTGSHASTFPSSTP
jgi:hypothetical protein